MKYLHVIPPWQILNATQIYDTPSIPLGATYCAASAMRAGWDAVVWFADIMPLLKKTGQSTDQHPIWDDFRETFRRVKPDVVAVSAFTPTFPAACKICDIVKQENPQCKTVIGGPHVSALPTDAAKHPTVDAAVVGEGEGPLTQLLDGWRRADSLLGLPGVVATNDIGEIVDGGPATVVSDLDELPWPAKSAVLDPYGRLNRDSYGLIMNSRGCPYACEFCASSLVWSRTARYRSAANLADEMLAIHRMFDTRYFSFEDDTFTLNRRHTMALMEAIIERGLPSIPGFRWTANTRPDRLDRELLEKMKEAGCVAVAQGIETGSERLLKKINKGFTAEDVIKAAAMIRDVGLNLTAQMIFGFPTETPEEMWETVRFTEQLDPESITYGFAFPLPSTPLFAEAVSLGLIPTEGIDWATFLTSTPGMLMTVKEGDRYVPMPTEQRAELVAQLCEPMGKIQRRNIEKRNAVRRFHELQYMPEDEAFPLSERLR